MALVNNQAALNTVYNHFLTSYAPKSSSAQDTHKKSELRSIYNSIVKQNKESPLYLLHTTKETQEFAVGMKENARELKNTISSLSSDDTGDVLDKKAASSSNEDVVTAKFIGNVASDEEDPSFQVEVNNLASSQVNLGKFIPSGEMVLSPDTYSFDIHVNNTDYEFQFNIGEKDTNMGIQTKLSNLLNRSNIGIESSVVEDGNGRSALRLESTATGIEEGQDSLFSVSDDKTSKATGAVSYFGIDEMTSAPVNASFSLNGIERSAYSNTFTVDKKFEITLKGISSAGDSATIGLKPDVESLTENVNQLVGSYNDFLKKAHAYSSSNTKSERLLSEMNGITGAYRNELDAMGLSVQEDGSISIDHKLLTQTIEEDDAREHFGTLRAFTNSLVRKSNQISLNPMNYVDKTVVAYKNPGKSFANPYITSMYSGMMFNSYC